MIDVAHPYFDSHLSWLSYNYRLLMEARDNAVPVGNRVGFLGRFSSQTDEFLRVKIHTLQALKEVSRDILEKQNLYPEPLLEHIHETLESQLEEFNSTLSSEVLPALFREGVHLYFKEPFHPQHQLFVRNYFTEKILRYLQPVFLDTKKGAKALSFEAGTLYYVVRMFRKDDYGAVIYAYVNIPSRELGRFVVLPDLAGVRQVAFLDDLIRENMSLVFPGFETIDCFSVLAERESPLELEDDFPAQVAQRIHRQLEKKNFVGSRLFYSELGMSDEMRAQLIGKAGLSDITFYERGRYLKYQDFDDFPFFYKKLYYPAQQPVDSLDFPEEQSVFDSIRAGDRLLHLPYHSHFPLVRFFTESAADPNVKEIYVSLYKISANSFIVNSLISAARNGKKVITFVEPNSQLDLQENLQWTRKLKEAGVRIIFSLPGLYVSARLALVKKKSGKGWERYAYIGTGSFYRLTARESVDHCLLTANRDIANELEFLFGYLGTREEPKKYRFLPFHTLMVCQFNMQKRLVELIDREIRNALAGSPSRIVLKISQIQDQALIAKLYQAGRAGVDVVILVKDCCSIIPDLPTISENISVIRLVDRYQENSRILYFHNKGNPELFLTSTDWTYRNLNRRIDICIPVLDAFVRSQLIQVLSSYEADNQKLVRLDTYQTNVPVATDAASRTRAQEANYRLVEQLNRRLVDRAFEKAGH